MSSVARTDVLESQQVSAMELVDQDGAVIVTPKRGLELFDISDLEAEARARLFSSIDQFNRAHNRLNDELFQMCLHLTVMREILGEERFYRFATEALGFNQKRISRMLKLYRILNIHFTEADGKFHPNRVEKFSQSALLMLADDTDSEVVAMLEDMAKEGKVSANDVKKLIEQHAAEQEASVKALTAEMAQERKAAQEARDRFDLDLARERQQSEARTEQLRRLDEQRNALEEDVRQLQEQVSAQVPKTQIIEKVVEIVPAGYASLADALAGTEAKLNEQTRALERVNSQLEENQAKSAQVQQSLAVKQAGAEELGRLRAKIEEVQMMFPAALLTKIKSTDQNIAAELAALGELLILTGKQFLGA